MAKGSLASRVERELEQQTNLNVVVEQDGDTLVVSGKVDSALARDEVLALAAELAPGTKIDDNLEIELLEPQSVLDLHSDEPGVAQADDRLPEQIGDIGDVEGEVEPSFNDQPLQTDMMSAVEENLNEYQMEATEEPDTVYFPPTDPVVTPSTLGNVHVVGGFSPTSDTTVEVARSTDGTVSDDSIADAVRRELREDASTTDLRLQVHVRDGVVRLRGRVRDTDDVENAEAIAAEVPGVVEVIEELEVAGL